MSFAETLRKDPRRRNLALLAAFAIIVTGLAVGAVWNRATELSPPSADQAFFPQLHNHMRDVAQIQIVTKTGTLTAKFRPDRGWILPDHHNYPASFNTVRKMIVGLTAMEIIAPKTARADWLHYIDLKAPPKGKGTRVTFRDDKGKILADVIAGKTEDIGDSAGGIGLFVRHPNSDQSWLVRSVMQPDAKLADWLDSDVMDVPRARIHEVDVTPVSGPAFTVLRDKPSQGDFRVSDMPKGRVLAYDSAADNVAAAITGFTFTDVRPAKYLDFTNSARLTTKTFDGLTIRVEAVKDGADVWATVSAEGSADKADSRKEARAINAKSAGWAYKLPSFKAEQFMTTLDSLLKPLDSQTAPAK